MGMALANNSWQSISVPAPGGGAYCYSWADLSPDGTLIVFQRQQTAQAKPDLWLMDAARTEARQLTNTASLSESDPRWSPDGTVSRSFVMAAPPPRRRSWCTAWRLAWQRRWGRFPT
jgi:dipeptidyl aminopeptidase/acylaminoacyl peptidase